MSSLQLDAAERGFSYSYDAPLDMRMDPRAGARRAADLVNEWPQARLAAGAARASARSATRASIAREIVAPAPALETTSELVEAIRAGGARRRTASARGHPAKRTFQAIRIAVNGELDSLERALPRGVGLLPIGGRLAAISFHSLEDRRVKRFLAARARGCICPPELPVCVCGREPEAELLTRARRVAPAPEERRAQPALALGAPARRAQADRPRRAESAGCRRRAAAATARRAPRRAHAARAPAPPRRPRRPAPRRAPTRARSAPRIVPRAVGPDRLGACRASPTPASSCG